MHGIVCVPHRGTHIIRRWQGFFFFFFQTWILFLSLFFLSPPGMIDVGSWEEMGSGEWASSFLHVDMVVCTMCVCRGKEESRWDGVYCEGNLKKER